MQRPQGSASGEPGPPRWPVVNISSPLKPLREPLSTRKAASHARVSSDHAARLPRKVTPWWVKSDPGRSSGALLRSRKSGITRDQDGIWPRPWPQTRAADSSISVAGGTTFRHR